MADYISFGSYSPVGDGVADDYPQFQQFLNDLAVTGGYGVMPPKRYMMGSSPLLAMHAGVAGIKLEAMGATLLTDPTKSLTALTVQNQAAVVRQDESRQIVISGLKVDQYENPLADFGIHVIGTTHVTLEDIAIAAGSDNSAKKNQGNYMALRFLQADPHNGDTGDFWTRLNRITIKGATFWMPYAILINGQDNDWIMTNSNIANANNGVTFQADADGNIANAVQIDHTAFEGVGSAANIYLPGTIPTYTGLTGFQMTHNRLEQVSVGFNYGLSINHVVGGAPILRDNWRLSNPTYVNNPHGLTVNIS